MEANVPAEHARRPRRILVAVLLTLAVITGFVGMFAVWANRQALNTENWTQTSSRLLENKAVQTALSAYLVDELFSNVDVAAALRDKLPPQAAALAGPAAAGLQQLAGRVAPRILANPKVQDVWRNANEAAHKTLIRILDDKGKVVSTANGVVTLNLHDLVDQLAGRLGIQSQVDAVRSKLQGSAGDTARGVAQEKLGVTLPPKSGEIEIMRSEELGTAQDIAKLIRGLAVLFTAIPLLLFALAIALASGWRRVALRTTGWCFVGLGLTVLIARRVGGNEIVDSLVASESVKPAGHAVWSIGTTLLHDIALAMVFYGVALVIAAWLAGATRPALAVRGALAPALRYRVAASYGALALLFVLLLAWNPTPAMRKPLGILLFAALLVLGLEVLRRQVRREFPDAQPGQTWDRLKAWFEHTRSRMSEANAERRERRGAAPPPSPGGGRFDALEQLAALHERGAIDDDEYKTQKTLILNGG